MSNDTRTVMSIEKGDRIVFARKIYTVAQSFPAGLDWWIVTIKGERIGFRSRLARVEIVKG